MDEAFLTGPQVLKRYGISEMTLYRWLKDEGLGFPKPMVVNGRRFFKEGELTNWERVKAADAA